MLYIYGERSDGWETFKDYPPRHLVSLEQAAIVLIKRELAFGGRLVIQQCNPCQIVVRTPVLAKVDMTWCTADTEEEMRPLAEMAACYLGVDVALGAAERTKIWYAATPPDVAGNPFLIANLLPILVGEQTGKVAMLAYVAGKLSQEADEGCLRATAERLKSFDLERLVRIAANVNEHLDLALDDYLTIYA